MAGNSGIEQARFKGMLEPLQQQDPAIDHIIVYSKFVVAYLLHQDGPNQGWRKANMEGPVYLVRRRDRPRYQLLVKNQFTTNDLLDSLHPDWELDCQKNYVFYKVEDSSKRIRGLWFHDDAERQKIEAALEQTLGEIRHQPSEPQVEPQPMRPQQMKPPTEASFPKVARRQDATSLPGHVVDGSHMDSLYAQFGLTKPSEAAAQERVTVSMASVRSALHALADDESFITLIMQKLKDHQPRPGPVQ